MSKKLILVFACVVFFSSTRLVFASLVINEIMYDPQGTDTGREWIEVHNTDSISSVNLSKWYFFSDNTKHSLNPQGTPTVPADGYAVIVQDPAKFLKDWPDFSGLIFDSSWSELNNTTGETIALKDSDLNLVSETPYSSSSGGQDDGNSLQLVGGSWVAANPTPGLVNSTIAASPVASDNSGTDQSSSNSTSVATTYTSSGGGKATTKSKTTADLKIVNQITSKTLGFRGVPVSFQATTFGHNGEKVFSGNYFWNFGDGGSVETNLMNNQPVSHIFYYPGDYVVSLDYYQSYFSDASIPDASNQINIKIIPEDIYISNVGDENDFFVELTNNTNYNADLSNWVLVSAQKGFKIPKNTFVAPKQKIIISSRITNFSILDKDTLKLLDPEGNTIFDYSSPDVGMLKSMSSTPGISKISTPTKPPLKEETANSSLSADSSLSFGEGQGGVSSESSSSSVIIYLFSFIFIIIAALAVYFVRRKKVIHELGDDFKILDE